VAAIVLVGRKREGWTSLADRPRPGLGPLGGIAAALHHAEVGGYDEVLTIGCDMPRLPAGLVEALVAQAPAYCRDAPILGCWPASAIAGLDRYLDADDAGPSPSSGHGQSAKDPRLSIRRWASAVDARPIAAPTPIPNVNTPADLAGFAARARADSA